MLSTLRCLPLGLPLGLPLIVFLVCGCVLKLNGDEPTREQAVAALHRAVHFFRSEASVEGGYVFRWSEDLKLREGENRVGTTTAWIEPPGTPAVGMAYLDAFRLTADPVLLEAAQETAAALLRGQMISGGWTEQIEFAPADRAKYAYRVEVSEANGRNNTTTFDDNKTQSCIQFLMQLDQELNQQDVQLHAAVQYALQAVLNAQYANGAWPQKHEPRSAKKSDKGDTGKVVEGDIRLGQALQASYPSDWPRQFPAVKYSDFYTLNDSTLTDLIETMLMAWDLYDDPRYFESAKRGGEFLLLAQMPAPQPGWAQQYNTQMHPVWARKFEPAAITGGESQGIMRTLLVLYRRTADKRYLTAVDTALDYYQSSLLPNGRLARFYELHTNRPLYFTKAYELTYTADDLPTHYGFIVGSSLDRIERELREVSALAPDKLWRARSASQPKADKQLTATASEIIAALDERGAWVEAGQLKTHDAPNVQRIISSSTFISNLKSLATFVAAQQ